MKKEEKDLVFVDSKYVSVRNKFTKDSINRIYSKALEIISSKYDIDSEYYIKEFYKKGSIYFSKIKNPNIVGYYISKTGNIHLRYMEVENSLSSIVLHEIIHKMQNSNHDFILKRYSFIPITQPIVEGVTESTTSKLTGGKHQSFIKNKTIYPFSPKTSGYCQEVTLVNQIGKLIDDEQAVPDMALKGDTRLVDKFVKQFGLSNYLSLVNFWEVKENRTSEKIEKFYDEVLLKKCFDIKFKKCREESDYLKTLEDLKDFEAFRIEMIDSNEFETYYNQKLEYVRTKFVSKKIDTSILEEFVYKKRDLSNIPDEKKLSYEGLQNFYLECAIQEQNQNLKKLDLSDARRYSFEKDNSRYVFLVSGNRLIANYSEKNKENDDEKSYKVLYNQPLKNEQSSQYEIDGISFKINNSQLDLADKSISVKEEEFFENESIPRLYGWIYKSEMENIEKYQNPTYEKVNRLGKIVNIHQNMKDFQELAKQKFVAFFERFRRKKLLNESKLAQGQNFNSNKEQTLREEQDFDERIKVHQSDKVQNSNGTRTENLSHLKDDEGR